MTQPIEDYDDLTRIYDDTVYLYDPEQNPERASLPGIPLRHLRQADLEGLTEQQIRSLERTGWYTTLADTARGLQEAASAPEEAPLAVRWPIEAEPLAEAPEEAPEEAPAERRRSFNRNG